MIKKIVLIAIIFTGGYLLINGQTNNTPSPDSVTNITTSTPTPATKHSEDTQKLDDSEKLLDFAFKSQQSDLQVEGRGTVKKLLSDDTKGSQHQRFILELSSGQTLLVAHNIDLAPRIENLKTGDTVRFFGEYEWNEKGGVIHWTHKDPAGRHTPGWLKHQGTTYQ